MELYKELNTPQSKEFEQLLNNQLSKAKIEEGKIIDGKINKITEKYMSPPHGICSPRITQKDDFLRSANGRTFRCNLG